MPIRKSITGPAETQSGSDALKPKGDGEDASVAFDAFIERGLHELYDRVLAEPIPDELLKLIDDDRNK